MTKEEDGISVLSAAGCKFDVDAYCCSKVACPLLAGIQRKCRRDAVGVIVVGAIGRIAGDCTSKGTPALTQCSLHLASPVPRWRNDYRSASASAKSELSNTDGLVFRCQRQLY